MNQTDPRYRHFVQILREELVPAMGCTEPIAIAYGAAKAREVLGRLPERMLVEASGNIIKNVKSVVVPNTGGLKGIEAAAAAGAVAGDAGKILEVISCVTGEQKDAIRDYLAGHEVKVRPAEGDVVFDIILTLWAGEDQVRLRIADYHTNIVLIEKNGEALLRSGEVLASGGEASGLTDRSCLTVEAIVDFADTVDPEDIRELVQRQIDYNWAIAQEGMSSQWGANIGKVLRSDYGEDVKTRARYMAAAGSDARMSGCSLPVVINSGSGNQGMTASLPVIEYAKGLNVEEEKLYRALCISNLLAQEQKKWIGSLSAYCGAVCAAAGAGAAITYLCGGTLEQIGSTVTNTICNIGGMVCDGAKPSCAAKIASAVDAAVMAHNMSMKARSFANGDGLMQESAETTIQAMGYVGRIGMKQTDVEILNLMLGNTEMEKEPSALLNRSFN